MDAPEYDNSSCGNSSGVAVTAVVVMFLLRSKGIPTNKAAAEAFDEAVVGWTQAQ